MGEPLSNNESNLETIDMETWSFVIIVPAVYLTIFFELCALVFTWGILKDQPLFVKTWLEIIGIHHAAIILATFCILDMKSEYAIEFTKEEVIKRGLWRTTTIKWAEVTRVIKHSKYLTLRVIELCTEQNSIQIRTVYYKKPEEVLSLIKDSVPDSAIWYYPRHRW
jgi:hypothetical protein